MEKRRLEIDGFNIVPQDEMQSFLCRVRFSEYGTGQIQFAFTLPIEIARAMNIQKNEVFLIAIRRAKQKEIEDYKQTIQLSHSATKFSIDTQRQRRKDG